jgi:hypothetical protein
MDDSDDTEAAKPAPPPSPFERRTKLVYQVLLVLSLVGNGALALRNQANSERLAALTEQKTSLEAKLLNARSLPAFSFSRVRYEVGKFDEQVRKGQLVPFLEGVKDYRIIENSVFQRLQKGMQSRNDRQDLVTLLLVVNVGEASAASLRARRGESSTLDLGELRPNAAILIPVEYAPHRAPRQPVREATPVALGYQSALLPGTQHEVAIPPPSAQSWVPTIGKLQGVSRSAVTEGNAHLTDILPPAKD